MSVRPAVPLTTLAIGLVALLLWAGAAPSEPGPTAGDHRVPRSIDLNRPEALAWALELGPASDTPRGVTCQRRQPHVFVCHGHSPDGTAATFHILVSVGGTSWTSEELELYSMRQPMVDASSSDNVWLSTWRPPQP